MNPVLAGLLPLLITIGLALIALAAVGVFSWLMIARTARGDYEPTDEGDDE